MIGTRLGIMMFLQFFIWGAWYVTAYLFLGKIGFDGPDIGWTYSVGPIAGMLSPFFVGMIADRFFSSERVLGVLHLVGAGVMYFAATQMQVESPDATTINLLFFGYMLCYFPTLSLTNSLALHNTTNAEKQFPLIRVFGTIGWIVAGVVVSAQAWDASVNMFYLASGAAALMGLYCFTLPHTPPQSAGTKITAREVLGLDALVLLKQPSFLAFMVCSFLVCIPLSFYYQLAGKFVDQGGLAYPAFKMSFGQMSEIFFMLVMPLFFARLGVKWMLFVGILAWVVRYALFALGATDGQVWMLMMGILLHGICYDFFFVTGQIYTDRVAPKAIRGQAQGMLVLFTLGLGMFIGAQTAGQVEARFTPKNSTEIVAKAKVIGEEIKTIEDMVGLIEGTKEEVDVIEGKKDKVDIIDKPIYVRVWRSIAPKSLSADDQKSVDTMKTELVVLRKKRSEILLTSVDWKWIWTIPAIGAGVVLVLFTLLFKDRGDEEPIDESDIADAASHEAAP